MKLLEKRNPEILSENHQKIETITYKCKVALPPDFPFLWCNLHDKGTDNFITISYGISADILNLTFTTEVYVNK